MPKINSRQKGAAGEREARDFWIEYGYTARRGQQFSGSPDSPDIIVDQLPRFHFEIKRVQKLNLSDAIAQSQRDARHKIPLVQHRQNGEEWIISMAATTFAEYFAPFFKDRTE